MIKLVDNVGVEHMVIVPEGMMSDIVRPLWDSYVSVSGLSTENGIQLDDIRRVARKSQNS